MTSADETLIGEQWDYCAQCGLRFVASKYGTRVAGVLPVPTRIDRFEFEAHQLLAHTEET